MFSSVNSRNPPHLNAYSVAVDVLFYAGTLEYHVKWFMNPWFLKLRNGEPRLAAQWEDRGACTRCVDVLPVPSV